jgi:predicted membrane chloride channel (bestrophin family)
LRQAIVEKYRFLIKAVTYVRWSLVWDVIVTVDFMLLAVEKIGKDLQSPFLVSEHEIQMTALCTNIERNLDSMLRDARVESGVV